MKTTVITLYGFIYATVSAAGIPDVNDLLDRCAAAQAKPDSFIVTIETAQTGKGTHFSNVPLTCYSRSETRFDGVRLSYRRYIWGAVNAAMKLSQDRPGYDSDLWNGETFYQYTKAPDDRVGHLIIRRYTGEYDKTAPAGLPIIKNSPACMLKGYFPQEDGNIVHILRRANRLSVRRTMEPVDGSACYVLDARAASGRYIVWIDPQHGCRIARMNVRKEPGDVVFSTHYRLPENDHVRTFYKDVKFEKHDDIWVPVRWQTGMIRKTTDDKQTQTTDYTVTDITLNPDHEKLQSFIPDDIPNGTQVRLGNGGTMEFDKTRYIWRDGKPLPETGSGD